MELNFFDTNPAVTIFCLPLGILLEEMPIWDRNLYVSLCIEVLQHEHGTEPVVAISVTVSNIRIQHTSSIAVVEIATTYNEGHSRYSLIPLIYIKNNPFSVFNVYTKRHPVFNIPPNLFFVPIKGN